MHIYQHPPAQTPPLQPLHAGHSKKEIKSLLPVRLTQWIQNELEQEIKTLQLLLLKNKAHFMHMHIHVYIYLYIIPILYAYIIHTHIYVYDCSLQKKVVLEAHISFLLLCSPHSRRSPVLMIGTTSTASWPTAF